MKKGYKLLLVLSIVFASILFGCSKVETKEDEGLVSLQEFNQLEANMSYEEVTELLGKPKESKSGKDSELINDNQKTHYWDGVAPDSFIMLTFVDGKLTQTHQMGLK